SPDIIILSELTNPTLKQHKRNNSSTEVSLIILPTLGMSQPKGSVSAQKEPSRLDSSLLSRAQPQGASHSSKSQSKTPVYAFGPSLVSQSEIEFEVVSIRDRCITRSSSKILYELDLEIDRTLRRLRKVRSFVISNSSSSNSVSNSDNTISATNDFDFSKYSSFDINLDSNLVVSNFQELEQMENNDQTLKELAMPDVLEPTQSYELKSGLIHLLPKFHGLAGEDPHKYLKEFHVVCSTMRPQGIPEDYIKMKAFPFSLDGATKD
ncbi:hypothetical protein CR513_41431, partial [Mucuna pruriens]